MHRCGPEILISFACIFGKYGMATNVINGTVSLKVVSRKRRRKCTKSYDRFTNN